MASPQVPPSPAATPTPLAPSCPSAQPTRTKAAPEGAAVATPDTRSIGAVDRAGCCPAAAQCGSAARGTRHTRHGPRRPSGYGSQIVRSTPPQPNRLQARVRPQAGPRTRTDPNMKLDLSHHIHNSHDRNFLLRLKYLY